MRLSCSKIIFTTLAMAAAKQMESAPLVLNAANEIAVEAFLDGQLPYIQIPQLIDDALQSIDILPVNSLGIVLEADEVTRNHVTERIQLA